MQGIKYVYNAMQRRELPVGLRNEPINLNHTTPHSYTHHLDVFFLLLLLLLLLLVCFIYILFRFLFSFSCNIIFFSSTIFLLSILNNNIIPLVPRWLPY